MVPAFGAVTFWLATASMAVSAAGAWISIRIARRVGAIDVPNERSSHSNPTPRLGGVPMIAGAMLALVAWIYAVAGATHFPEGLKTVLVFGLVISALGFWDDLSGLSPFFRLLVQLAGATVLLWAGSGTILEKVGWGTVGKDLWILAGSVWAVWILNLYNFMDGIDGLAGGEAAVASFFFFLVFAYYGERAWAAANLFVASAAIGFLVHNWPPARIFMGDAGSAFLGAFYGMQSIVAPMTTSIPFVILVIPFTNFILDTTITLLGRVWRGERWYAAHRSHFYQRMTNLGMSHGKVTILELLALALSCVAGWGYLRSAGMGRIVLISMILVAFLAAGVQIRRMENQLHS